MIRFGSALLTRLLTSAPALALKRPVKDVWWRLRGRFVRQPPVPPHVRSMLFVCKGNICRSPFAAKLAERLLREQGLTNLVCTSAGLRSQTGSVPPDAIAAARAFGVELVGHRPQAFTSVLAAAHEMIIVMETRQLREIANRFPAFRERLFLLPLFVPPGERPQDGVSRYNIADPFGKSPEEFAACYAQIERSLRSVMARWSEHGDGPRQTVGRQEGMQG